MSWLRFDDDMLDHEKWRSAIREGGDAVLLVWFRLTSWCSRRLTDGRIPPGMVAEIAGLERSKSRVRALHALVESGLCTRHVDGAIVISGYLERNPSKADVLAERERRAQAQRNRTHRGKLTGQRLVELPEPDDVALPERALVPIPAQSQSRPNPNPEGDPERARPLDAGGVSRTYTMPPGGPPKAYLDEAVMRSVPRDQAVSTWEHYDGAGLPPGGVEKLYPWLCKRAKERTNQLARAPKSGPRESPGSDLDTTSAATAFRLDAEHREFATKLGRRSDIEAFAREYAQGETCKRLDTLGQSRDFMNRLKCLAHTGQWHPDGPLPKPPAKAREARA